MKHCAFPLFNDLFCVCDNNIIIKYYTSYPIITMLLIINMKIVILQ